VIENVCPTTHLAARFLGILNVGKDCAVSYRVARCSGFESFGLKIIQACTLDKV